MICRFRIWFALKLIGPDMADYQSEIAQRRLEYAQARKAHRGQREAQARLRAALHRSLARELLR